MKKVTVPKRPQPVNPGVEKRRVFQLLRDLRWSWNYRDDPYVPRRLVELEERGEALEKKRSDLEAKLLNNAALKAYEKKLKEIRDEANRIKEKEKSKRNRIVDGFQNELTLLGPIPSLCQRILRYVQSLQDDLHYTKRGAK